MKLTSNQKKVLKAIKKLHGSRRACNTVNVRKLSGVARASVFGVTRQLEGMGLINVKKVGTEGGKRGWRIFEPADVEQPVVEETIPPHDHQDSGILTGLTYSDLGKIVSSAIIGMADKLHILQALNQTYKGKVEHLERTIEEAEKAIKENNTLRARVDNLTQMFVELQSKANIPEEELPIVVRQAIENNKKNPFFEGN